MAKVSDYLAEFLALNGVTHVFELSGGMIAHLLDSFSAHPKLRVVSVHHEQAGAFAAEAFARLTGRPAVALGTSGPGALNLVTGIASCYYDSVPALFFTGQVQTYMRRRERAVRQFGLQECAFAPIAAPIAKDVHTVERAGDVPEVLAQAYRRAIEGRPGPVVVELPFDVQGAALDATPRVVSRPVAAAPPRALVTRALDALMAAARPVVLAGGGVRAAGAAQPFLAFVRRLGIPVATTIGALDLLPADDPLRVGMPGMYGLRAANAVLTESDAVLVLGCRLDAGQIGADPALWRRGKVVIRVDCDAGELAERTGDGLPIEADLAAFFRVAASGARRRRLDRWRARVDELRKAWPDTDELAGCPGINPNELLRDLSRASRGAGAYVVDAGQHTWWTAQSVRLAEGQRFLAGTGLWALGAGLPGAVGAALAGRRPIVLVAGDAALQLNIQELHTIVRERLPVKIVVLDNRCHGMVRQFQQEFFAERYPSTLWGYSPPDLVKVAGAYGLPARTVVDARDAAGAIAWLWERPEEACLLRVEIDPMLNVIPWVPFGRPLSAMQPPRPVPSLAGPTPRPSGRQGRRR